MDSKTDDIVSLIVEGIQERKGKKISVIDLAGISSAPAHHFVICQGTSTSHVTAVADSVRDYVCKHGGRKPYRDEGYRTAQWIILDYGEVFLHVFLPDVRDRYRLEELWGDAQVNEIPDLD